MKRPKAAPRVLLVEGGDEQYVLPELIEIGGVPWPKGREPLWVENCGSVDNVLRRETITTELKAAGLEALGIVVDANGDIAARWQKVHTLLTSIRPAFPTELAPDGVVLEEPDQPRLGVWLMPDNLRTGMLETLLLAAGDDAMRAHVDTTIAKARELGAPFKDAHRDKARLHSWLAWQDPPGQALGTAAKMGMLAAAMPVLAPFVAWIRRLYRI